MFRIPFFFFNMALILLFWMKEMENTYKELYFRMVIGFHVIWLATLN